MRFAYADPPYPGMAHLYKDHPDYAGEVDHKALIARLVEEFPDGWALSTSMTALREVWGFCPDDVMPLIWVKPNTMPHPWYQSHIMYCYEPVLLRTTRSLGYDHHVRNVLIQNAPTHPTRFMGQKPEPFCFWLFRCLGALPGDELVDLNPKVKPDIVASILAIPLSPYPLDLLWSSPPCEMYSTKYQFAAWHPNAPDPDLRPWQATLQIIDQWQPRYWVIENVWAAQKIWGKATFHFGSRYLWTNLPMLGQPDKTPIKMGIQENRKRKERGGKKVPYAQSSKIEYSISLTVCAAVEHFLSCGG